ncbi:hypothetical protein RIF29_00875 [Crotalaria pallida]|uniref:Uncharacterized protein n=1 Tax=Crotalaria pallida TaxID=3830 RepID=A0AAN9IWS3_CROPI
MIITISLLHGLSLTAVSFLRSSLLRPFFPPFSASILHSLSSLRTLRPLLPPFSVKFQTTTCSVLTVSTLIISTLPLSSIAHRFSLSKTPEILELSKEIKEKLKEADQCGIIVI